MPYSHAAAWDEYRSSSQLIGVDPIMGNADWISCTITVDGRYSYSDYASRGDGTDSAPLLITGSARLPTGELSKVLEPYAVAIRQRCPR